MGTETKKVSFGDKMLFILGLILCGFFATLLVVGVIIALFTTFKADRDRTIRINSVPMPKGRQAAALTAPSNEEKRIELIRLPEERPSEGGVEHG